ncbi:MAG TPA: DUF4175 family protein [Bacteroidales bacterium]|jgi:hypothetical protein|nr:hypothetical protein [Bacteroidota bacterium]HJN06617.1 DUF4175 family protein [Bacteroidales bacterium]
MITAFEILISKLNKFIRKYYLNLIIKGVLLSFGLVIMLFLLVSVFEYFSWSDIITRTVIFYLFVLSVLLILVYYIILPALKLIKLGKIISQEEAALIIGEHFPEVNDKLLNTLQLHNHSSVSNMELLLASIEQKSASLNPVPFKNAVKYKKNLRYLKLIVPPALLLLLILVISPGFVFEPADRIINHNTYFSKPLPYKIELLNKDFTCAQHENYSVKIVVHGNEVPSKIWTTEGGFRYRMIEVKPGEFEYTFNDLVSDKYFSIVTDDFASDKYHLRIYPQPVIFNFDVFIRYPKYLLLQNEKIENTGDLIVPEGSSITWAIFTRDTESVYFIADDSLFTLSASGTNVFKHSLVAMHDLNYTLVANNQFMQSTDSMQFNVQVIADEYPFINVNEFKDELNYGVVNFSGSVVDDHGFTTLYFYYRKDSVHEKEWNKIALDIQQSVTRQHFDYMMIANNFDLMPGDGLSYYFEIRDNDAVNGFKRTKSELYYFKLPDALELEKKIENSSNEIKSKLKESLDQVDELTRQIEETKLNLFGKKELSWMDKQLLEDLLKKEEGVKKQLEELKKLNDDINELEDLLKKKLSPELLEKLKQLEDLFNELVNKDLEKLKENLEKDKINDFLEKMKEQNEELKNDLEQNLELYKQLEYEKLIQESIDELNKLSEEQKNLSDQTVNKKFDKEKSLENQDEVEKKFSDLMDKLDKASELNKELEEPYNVKTDTAMASEIDEQIDDAQKNIQKGRKNKASDSQENAGNKMKEMADGLSLMMQGAMEARMGEDIEQVKNMLDNLLDISFAQELLIKDLQKITINDPKNDYIREQQKGLKDDFEILHDSLIALSKRQVTIQPFIVKESDKINKHIDRALSQLQDRNNGKASADQQYSMTSMNNLSLMLSESLEQMKQSMQMSSNQKGSGKCKSPGKGNSPSMSEIMNQQKGLNKGLKGKTKKNGLDGKNGLNSRSEELARMAAAQGAIRKMLQEFIEQLKGEGADGGALQKLAEDMKKSEDDIVNRRVSQETLERQKNIETRLLRSQKALHEREKEKKRESKEGINRKTGNLNSKIEYKTTTDIKEEILITDPLEVSPYYRNLLKEYLYKLERKNEDGK